MVIRKRPASGRLRPLLAILFALYACEAVATGEAEHDFASLAGGLKEHQARLAVASSSDTACESVFRLSETESDGEHTVYGAASLPQNVKLKLRARASSRYAIQLGLASGDWASYAIADVSLVSGAHTTIQGGYLQVRDVEVKREKGGWRAIELSVANLGDAQRPSAAAGNAFVKLIADGDSKYYAGKTGYGVELCADRP